jgi:Sulfotransferase family
MVVCVTGMHRSGTSMVARILNVCGLYLGAESDLLNPSPANPEGFWENRRFVEINEELLAAYGGAWDLPPIFPPGWEAGSDILQLRAQAERLVRQFVEYERWGWKDPRTSLTLSFWKNLVPDLKVVACIRNPFEVARSLQRRDHNSDIFAFSLWQTYNERLLAATRPEDRLITHQDVYFVDPERELRRTLDWLGWSVSDETISQACSVVSSALRHHRVPNSERPAEGPTKRALTLYQNLCAEAGPIYEQSRYPDSPIALAAEDSDKQIAPAKDAARDIDQPTNINALQELILQEEREIETLSQEVSRVRSAYAQLEDWAHGLEAAALEREAVIRDYARELGPVLRLWRALRGRK